MRDDNKYRKGAGIMLLNENGEVFVGQRLDSSIEAWQMPQGGIDEGETPLQAMKREALEEIGTNNFEIITELDDWLYYDLPKDIAGKLWNGKYLGQMQKWYLLKFTGADSDININTEIPEFKEWKWAKSEDLLDLIVPFKRDLYSQILDGFKPHL